MGNNIDLDIGKSPLTGHYYITLYKGPHTERYDITDIIKKHDEKVRAAAIDEMAGLITAAFLNTKFDVTDVQPLADQMKKAKT